MSKSPRLAAAVDGDRDAWMLRPEAADSYNRLRVYQTPGNEALLKSLVKPGGPWHKRTWPYISPYRALEWGWAEIPKEFVSRTLGGRADRFMIFKDSVSVAMDVRDPAWQHQFAAKCAELVTAGHKGVFIDDVNLKPQLYAAERRPIALPKGWAEGMLGLVRAARVACPDAELVVNMPPADICWNGRWIEWGDFLKAPTIPRNPAKAGSVVERMLDLGVILEIERGFSDVNIGSWSQAIEGLASTFEAARPFGTRVVLDQQYGDPAFEAQMYADHCVAGVDWLSPL